MFSKKKIIITHNGGFHADDAFAVATLSLLHRGKAKVIRSREPQDWARGDYVVDVGGEYDPAKKRFDHHQKGGAGTRENGVPYAAFGLVWKEYGAAVSGSADIAARIDKDLVQPIDALDNGVGESQPIIGDVFSYDVSRAVSALNASWRESASDDECFARAVEHARGVIERLIVHITAAIEGAEMVRTAYEKAGDKRIIALDINVPWEEYIGGKPDVIFMVVPRENGTWGARAIRKDRTSFDNRKSFPEAWAGLRDAELARATGVADALFCHNKRFLAVAGTRTGAIALAQKALEP
ncbi:MAG: MYG1 family protein [Candidatus Paceibacterota bacterium]|jgi:uncharacterized UPF0160 family protein